MAVEASSFRDPAGRVILEDGVYIREINDTYLPEYHHLIDSGLYDEMVGAGYLLPHEELSNDRILPEQLTFITYPQEWCFSQLKEAALTTLEINQRALKLGMMLKAASAYNMQFRYGRPVLIDTLSFTRYEDGMPWAAHTQFVEHFLAPLLLLAYRKVSYCTIEGTPVDVASRLLPKWLRFNYSLLWQFYSEAGGKSIERRGITWNKALPKFSRRRLDAMLGNLYGLVKGLGYKPSSPWSRYEQESYRQQSLLSKNDALRRILNDIVPGLVWDIGTNTGIYSNYAALRGNRVIATDRDHDCIEQLYLKNKNEDVLPLVVDLCQPTPAIGWANIERQSFLDRIKPDTIMALALIHHLCIGNNVPLYKVAELLAAKCNTLIIEWVPPDDPMAVGLARHKVFPPYNQDIFEAEFYKQFSWVTVQIEDSKRVIYYMRKW